MSPGSLDAKFIFHFCFAASATTIVSGAVAERMKLTAYIVFSAANTFIYCIPASWAWHDTGFLKTLGYYDFAGGGIVHLSGGCCALVGALLVGPRLGRFSKGPDGQEKSASSICSPVTALTGTLILWWAWLAFNCGSTFYISENNWRVATKVAVTTIMGSIGGSMAGLAMGLLIYRRNL